jgi:hypothetical protein
VKTQTLGVQGIASSEPLLSSKSPQLEQHALLHVCLFQCQNRLKVLADEYTTLLHRNTEHQVKKGAETVECPVSRSHTNSLSDSKNYQGNCNSDVDTKTS